MAISPRRHNDRAHNTLRHRRHDPVKRQVASDKITDKKGNNRSGFLEKTVTWGRGSRLFRGPTPSDPDRRSESPHRPAIRRQQDEEQIVSVDQEKLVDNQLLSETEAAETRARQGKIQILDGRFI